MPDPELEELVLRLIQEVDQLKVCVGLRQTRPTLREQYEEHTARLRQSEEK